MPARCSENMRHGRPSACAWYNALAMSEQTIIIKGPVAATDMSFEDYLIAFDGQFAEWVDGVVIQMTPISDRHFGLMSGLRPTTRDGSIEARST